MNRPQAVLAEAPTPTPLPTGPKPKRRRTWVARLFRLVEFSAAHALFIFLAIEAQIALNQEPAGARVAAVALVFTAGGLMGGAATWICCAWLAMKLRWSARAALIMVVLTIFTLGAAAFLNFLQFRIYIAQFHEQTLNMIWLKQNIITALSSTGLFAMFGPRYLLPVGLLALFASTLHFLWMTKRGG